MIVTPCTHDSQQRTQVCVAALERLVQRELVLLHVQQQRHLLHV